MAADQNTGFEQFRKPTRRDEFLNTMNTIMPWSDLCAVIEPVYPKVVGGRPPIGLERMLRIHFLQHGFNLADLACEAALDATIIGAPSSTKNKEGKHDPGMHQSRKGQQWCFGMKLHIGVDSQSGLAHHAVVTSANVHDKHPQPDLLHGNERRVYGDNAYASQQDLIASKAPLAQDLTNDRIRNRMGEVDEAKRSRSRNKSRYRGLAKNAARAFTALALVNIYLARGPLMAQVSP